MTQSEPQPVKNLLDPSFVREYLAARAPSFARKHSLEGISVTPLKQIITRTVGEGFHHLVARYDAPSFGEYPVFATAYSKGTAESDDQSREHAFKALSFLKRYGFKNRELFLPKPLFFDRELKAFFYQGMDGRNLRAILESPATDISPYLEAVAQWLAELHRTPVAHAPHDLKDERIATTSPGPGFFERVIRERSPEHVAETVRLFRELAREEEQLMKQRKERWVIHGDLHPENVIVNEKTGHVSVTDFTDVSLGGWTKDVGTFLQQLGFMSLGFRNSEQTVAEQRTFLNAYVRASGRTLDSEARRRIALYRAWAALRSAIYFLTKKPIEKREAQTALAQAARHANGLQQLYHKM